MPIVLYCIVLLQLLRDVASELDGLIQDVTTDSSTASDNVTYTPLAPSTCEDHDLTSSDETIRQSSSPSLPETPKVETSHSIEATSHVQEMTSEVSVFMSKSTVQVSENVAVTSSTSVMMSHSMTEHSFKTDISSLPVNLLPLVEEEDEEDLDQLIFQLK